MLSENKLLQFNIENIRQAFVGGVVNNYIVTKTLLSVIALLYIIVIVNIVVKKSIKKTKKFGKLYCFGCFCLCGGCYNLMSCSCWRDYQMQQDFMRYCKKNDKKHFWQHHHKYEDHLQLHPALPKKCNNLIAPAKRFASMMRV